MFGYFVILLHMFKLKCDLYIGVNFYIYCFIFSLSLYIYYCILRLSLLNVASPDELQLTSTWYVLFSRCSTFTLFLSLIKHSIGILTTFGTSSCKIWKLFYQKKYNNRNFTITLIYIHWLQCCVIFALGV